MTFTLTVTTQDPVESARRASEAIPAAGVFYYALGGGLGHLTRGLALARQWSRLRTEPFVLFASSPISVAEPATLLRLEDRTPPPERLRRLVRELAAALKPALFAVDAFPAGILGELPELLPELSCPTAAVVRRLQSRWVEAWDLPQLLPRYTTVVAAEAGLNFLSDRASPPILIRRREEVLSRAEARGAFGAAEDIPLILTVTTGLTPADQGLQGLSVKIARRLGAELRLVSPHPPGPLPAPYVNHFPLAEWLPAADLVIAPCGYNLFHETRALGIPAVWVPQPRLYDDQFARAKGFAVAHSPEELDRLADASLRGELPKPTPVRATGGATAAARRFSDLAERGFTKD